MPSPLDMSFTDSLKYVHRRAFYDQHKLLAVSMILIVLILPFVGLLVSGLFGGRRDGLRNSKVFCLVTSFRCEVPGVQALLGP